MGDEKDLEKSYSNKEVVAKLRRLADALEEEKTFEIQIAGERIYVPPRMRRSSLSMSVRVMKKRWKLN